MKDNKNTNTVSSELGEGDLDQVSGGLSVENKPCPDCGSKRFAVFLFQKKQLVCFFYLKNLLSFQPFP